MSTHKIAIKDPRTGEVGAKEVQTIEIDSTGTWALHRNDYLQPVDVTSLPKDVAEHHELRGAKLAKAEEWKTTNYHKWVMTVDRSHTNARFKPRWYSVMLDPEDGKLYVTRHETRKAAIENLHALPDYVVTHIPTGFSAFRCEDKALATECLRRLAQNVGRMGHNATFGQVMAPNLDRRRWESTRAIVMEYKELAFNSADQQD